MVDRNNKIDLGKVEKQKMKTGPSLAQQLLKYGEQNKPKDADDDGEEESDGFDMGYISGKKINSEEDEEANRGFDSEEVAEYKDVFDYFDKKHTGYISAKQIGTTLRSLKPAPDEFIVLQKMDEIDHDFKGKVNFQQYLDVLHSVIRKSKQNKRKRSCYTNLSEKQMSEIKDAFTMFDHDGDGSISADELKAVMMNIGVYSTDEDVNDMVKELDADDSGSLDFPEFVSLMTRKISGAEVTNEMLEAFRYFDKDGDGTISAAEVRQVMDALGEDLSDSEIDEMIKEADNKGKGGVSYDDFVKMISSQ